MNFYNHISDKLTQSEFLNNIDSLLQNKETQLQICNLNQSSRALLIANFWRHLHKNIIVIAANDNIAEDLWDDLCVLIGSNKAIFLPDYEILPYEERSPHYSIRATRLEALVSTIEDKTKIYVISVRTALRWIQPKDLLKKNVLKLKKGDEINPTALISDLISMGYETSYQIEKIYQAAKRGGLLDIYSPPQKKPVRIEFFGDEIVSMRYFSLASQRSEAEVIKEITIIPAREISIQDIKIDSPVMNLVHENGLFEGIENYVGLLLDRVQTFIDYFNTDNTVLVWNDFPYLKDEINTQIAKVHESYQKIQNKAKRVAVPNPNLLFAQISNLEQYIYNYQSIFMSQPEFIFSECQQTIKSQVMGVKNYYGNLDELSLDIKDRQSSGEHIIIQFDNESQSNRMKTLLCDYNLEVSHYIGCLHDGFSIPDIGLSVFTDHEIFNRYKYKRFIPRFSSGEAIVDYTSLKPGDYIVHVDHGIGLFEGLKIVRIEGQEIECLSLRYLDNDKIYVPTFQLQIVSRYVSEDGVIPQLHKIGGKKWHCTKRKAKTQIALIASDILKLYAERNKRTGIIHDSDSAWQKELEDSFIYEDTPDQITATQDIKNDMEKPVPMERLLCGDVGFGKTEVAIRAAFKAIISGYQVAVLVPTTLLADQHFRVFRERLAQYPIKIEMLSRFRNSAQIMRDLVSISLGQIDIVIGTHRLLSKDIRFHNLGLLIIDEEHRFGVRQKERIRKLKTNVDTLYMSATPIPRTLNMALSKLKDISLIQTSPKERLPIRTIVTQRDISIIREAISREIDRGGQVFFIHNRIQSIESVAQELRESMLNIRIVVAHAQMNEIILEQVMEDFVQKRFDVLLSTTIIENGIDIPNANTIIIDRADTFGLAQLYQMRGRVGRSNRRAYAYLLISNTITSEARKRLDSLTQYDYLGAGFQVAMRDLEIRGAGTVLGTKQSGVIQSLGYNYYNKLLEKAFDCIINQTPEQFFIDEQTNNNQLLKTDFDLYFPNDYISDDKVRLEIYNKLNVFTETEDVENLYSELEDRFGNLPEKAQWLLTYYKVRMLIHKSDLNKCHIKKGEIILQFKSNKPPSQDKLLKLLNSINEKVRIETQNNITIFIELPVSAQNSYLIQLEILITILNNLLRY